VSETPEKLQHPNPSVWWFHRRSIAYMSMAGLFFMQVLILLGAVTADSVPLAQTISWVFGINILGYIANNAVENVAAMKFGNK